MVNYLFFTTIANKNLFNVSIIILLAATQQWYTYTSVSTSIYYIWSGVDRLIFIFCLRNDIEIIFRLFHRDNQFGATCNGTTEEGEWGEIVKTFFIECCVYRWETWRIPRLTTTKFNLPWRRVSGGTHRHIHTRITHV